MADQLEEKKVASETGRSSKINVKYKDIGDGSHSPVFASAMLGSEYETIGSNQTNQVMGIDGAVGDLVLGILVVPTSTSPGTISIKDGTNSSMTVFSGGTDSLGSLMPFYIPLNLRSKNGPWSITTGANLSLIVGGEFN